MKLERAIAVDKKTETSNAPGGGTGGRGKEPDAAVTWKKKIQAWVDDRQAAYLANDWRAVDRLTKPLRGVSVTVNDNRLAGME